ncbi:MAG: toxin-activating lysine-acyltransferase [Pseudomonadota bacterium]
MKIYCLDQVLAGAAVPADPQYRKALALGLALRLFGVAAHASQCAQQLARILPALACGQYEFYFDPVGRLVGGVTWALVNDKVHRAMVKHGGTGLAQSDWTGGQQPWIVDFTARDGALGTIMAHLRDQRLSKYDTCTYVTQKGRRRLVKQVGRSDRSSFMLRPQRARFGGAPWVAGREDFVHALERRFFKAHLHGQCFLALHHCDRYMHLSVASLYRVVKEIVALRQVRIYLSAQGAPAGMLTWAWLSERTFERVGEQPLHGIHPSEWNEGSALCLFDVAVSRAVRPAMEADIFGALFPEHAGIVLYRPPCTKSRAAALAISRQQRRIIGKWIDTHPSNASI